MNFIQTMLIGLVAAVIGFHLQHRAWRNQHFQKMRDSERQQARETADVIFDRIDKRLTLQRKFINLAKKFDPDLHSEFQRDYAAFLDDWNGKYSSTFANLQHIFNRSVAAGFDQEVHRRLRLNSDIAARAIRLGYENLSIEHKIETEELHDSFNVHAYHIRLWMRDVNRRIEAGLFGRSQHINSLSSDDESMLTHTYLLKRLLNLPQDTVRA